MYDFAFVFDDLTEQLMSKEVVWHAHRLGWAWASEV